MIIQGGKAERDTERERERVNALLFFLVLDSQETLSEEDRTKEDSVQSSSIEVRE